MSKEEPAKYSDDNSKRQHYRRFDQSEYTVTKADW